MTYKTTTDGVVRFLIKRLLKVDLGSGQEGEEEEGRRRRKKKRDKRRKEDR